MADSSSTLARRRRLRLAVAGFLIPLAAGVALAAPTSRIVALGDVHGDLQSLTTILQAAGVVDADLAWAGGTTTLVQNGDLLDRGTEIRQILDLVMRLEREAPEQGGEVIALLGNHEVMNLVLELRDNDVSQYAAFVDDDSEIRREQEHVAYAALAPIIDSLDVGDALAFTVLDRDAWMAANPPGHLEYIEAISPAGPYGAWLRQRRVVVKVDGTVFLHAGIGEADMQTSLEDIDREVHGEIDAFDAARAALIETGWALRSFHVSDLIRVSALLLQNSATAAALVGMTGVDGEPSPPYAMPGRDAAEAMVKLVNLPTWTSFRADGPMWYRGYDPRRPVIDFDAWFARLLERYDARHVAVGHTPQPNGRIRMLLNGALFLIDTGMLQRVYGGNPAALEIADGAFTAIYADAREPLCCGEEQETSTAVPQDSIAGASAGLDTRAWRGRDGEPLPFATDAEIEAFLRDGEVLEREQISTGITQPTRVLLEHSGVRARGIFRDVDETYRSIRLDDGDLRKNLRDYFGFEVAAYRVDRLLDLGMVPPAVERRLDGKPGAMQLWVENAIMEKERAEQGLSPQPAAFWRMQTNRMTVFDYIIGNDDRHAQNMLDDPDRWLLWLIDHTRAFQRDSPKVEGLLNRINTMDDEMWQKVRDVDPEQLEALLRDNLEGIRAREAMERHRNVIERIERLIAERGLESVIYPAR